jgi:hypothetical protein
MEGLIVKCNLVEKCEFFNDRLKDMPAMSEVLKERFCMREHKACARYLVFLEVGRDKIPENLFPNNIEKVAKLLSEAKED